MRLSQHMTAQGLPHLRPVEGQGQVQLRAIQRVQTKLIMVQAQVVPWRARPVIAEIIAAHVGIGSEPAGVIVAALSRSFRSRGRALAVRDHAVAARGRGDFPAIRRYVDHQPVHEIHARQIGAHAAAWLIHVVATAGHVDIDARQRERTRVRGCIAPCEVRVAVGGKHARLAFAALAEGEFPRDGCAVAEAVAVHPHDRLTRRRSRDRSRHCSRPTPAGCRPARVAHRPVAPAYSGRRESR